jgi:hypothetical protein
MEDEENKTKPTNVITFEDLMGSNDMETNSDNQPHVGFDEEDDHYR